MPNIDRAFTKYWMRQGYNKDVCLASHLGIYYENS
jgi:hypothetical protein